MYYLVELLLIDCFPFFAFRNNIIIKFLIYASFYTSLIISLRKISKNPVIGSKGMPTVALCVLNLTFILSIPLCPLSHWIM